MSKFVVFAFALLASIAPLQDAAADIDVSYVVTPIAQPSEMSCWATAATMLVDWKTGVQASISEVVGRAGSDFVAIYQASFDDPAQGIDAVHEKAFYDVLHLSYIQGENPTIQAWADLLRTHGPLSVTVDARPPKSLIHALVVTGLSGDGTADGTMMTYIDPSGGVRRDTTFAEFLKLYEGSASWPLQIIYN